MSQPKWSPFNPPQTAGDWLEAMEEHKLMRGRIALRAQQKGLPLAYGKPMTVDDMTCKKCLHESYCEYSWDLYNTNGDCLAEK